MSALDLILSRRRQRRDRKDTKAMAELRKNVSRTVRRGDHHPDEITLWYVRFLFDAHRAKAA